MLKKKKLTNFHWYNWLTQQSSPIEVVGQKLQSNIKIEWLQKLYIETEMMKW